MVVLVNYSCQIRDDNLGILFSRNLNNLQSIIHSSRFFLKRINTSCAQILSKLFSNGTFSLKCSTKPHRRFCLLGRLSSCQCQYCQMFYFTVLLDDTFSKKCHIGICANFEIPSWSRRNPTGLLVSSSFPFSSLRLVFLFG